jgi:transcriptional regulator with XRE-family HTH domain
MPYYRRLRDLREDNDLTQNQLVEKLNMHKTTYTNYEQGKRDLPLSIAIKIAKFYNVSLDYLAGITDIEK